MQFSPSEVKKLQTQLNEIDGLRDNGRFITEDGLLSPGSDEVSDLLDKCLLWARIVLERLVHANLLARKQC